MDLALDIIDGDNVSRLLQLLYTKPGINSTVTAALRAVNFHDLLPVLDKLTESADSEERYLATEGLFLVNRKVSLYWVVKLLADAESDNRCAAIRFLAEFKLARLAIHIASALQSDPDSRVRYLAAVTLGDVGDCDVLGVLRHAVAEDDGVDFEGRPIREAAAQAISDIEGRHPPS